MSHFAKVENGIVTKIIVAIQQEINSENYGDAFLWVQTSYNGNFRKNYAGTGYTYDSARDAFIPPQPYNSWTLNEDTCQWSSPVPYPTDDKRYTWDESTLTWDEVV